MGSIAGNLLRDKDKTVCCFDYETTSLSLMEALPWQVSWNISKRGKVITECDYYIWWPDLQMSAGAAAVTGFNYGKYEELARPKEEVWEIFKSYFYDTDHLLVGHNIIHYDIWILNTWRRLMGLPPDWSFLNRTIDTLALARAFRSESPAVCHDQGDEFLAWQYRMLEKRIKKCSLSEMAKEFDIEFDKDKLHDSRYDNLLGVQVFEKLKWVVEI